MLCRGGLCRLVLRRFLLLFLFSSFWRVFLLLFLPLLRLLWELLRFRWFLLLVPLSVLLRVLFLQRFLFLARVFLFFLRCSWLWFSYAFIFRVLQFLRRLGFVLTFPSVRTITQVGAGFFCFPALARRCFFAGGLA